MKKQNRLRKNHDFQRIISSKKSVVSKHLVIYYQPNKLNRSQIGISVSKKFANAVGRNRLRRQVRAILDDVNMFDLSFDIVLIVRKPFMTATHEDKVKSLKESLRRIK